MPRKRANLGGFSWRRAVGVTRVKGRIARTTGIPLTRSGRQRKVGKAVTGQGCLVIGVLTLIAVFATTWIGT